MISEIEAKKVLTYHENPFPTHWDVNPYRGCTVGCKYCFAQYAHQYLGLADFFKDIVVKTNISEQLDKELSSKKWQKNQIKIGGTTDLYQQIEQKYELMPKIYSVIKKHKNPIFIQTKSDLILRDKAIITELSKIITVDIATSVSIFDEKNRKIFEPGASSTLSRIKMIASFKGISRNAILGFMPIIPYLSDTDENLEQIFSAAHQNGIKSVITSFLFLNGAAKSSFFKIIEKHFPQLLDKYKLLYKSQNLDPVYKSEMTAKINAIKDKYQFTNQFEPVLPQKSNQLSLFDEPN